MHTDDITNDTTPTIAGMSDANSDVKLYNNGELIGQTTAGNDGKWEITTNNLTDGTYKLTAIATDIAGNVSNPSTPLQIKIDSALPQLTLTTTIDTAALKQGAKLTDNIDGSGTTIVALAYRFDNLPEIPIPFSITGVFDTAINFAGISNGQHPLTIIASDTAGNIWCDP